MRVMKTTINGIEYSRDNTEHVFLVPKSKLGNYRAKYLPNHSSLHVMELNDFDGVDLHLSVTNGNAPGQTDHYSIFLMFSIETEEFNDGHNKIGNIAKTIASISFKGYLDNPEITTEENIEEKRWRHYLTYYMCSEETGNFVLQELINLLFSAWENRKPPIKVFLCHSSADKQVVEQFANRLKLAGSHVWFDKWEIKVGDSIVDKINEGLETMTHLVIFLSNSSTNKPWVKKEISSALMRKLENNSVKVMPIKIDEVKIPTIISDIKYADCTEDLESGFNQLINDLLN